MKKILRLEFYRMFHNWYFYIALAIGAILSIWCLYMNCRANAWQLEMMDTATVVYYYPLSVFNSYIGVDYQQLASSIFYAVLPLVAALPAGASLASDMKSGYIKNVLIRCPRKSYYWAKAVSSFAGGFLVTAGSMLFSLITTAMFLPALKPIIASSSFPGIDTSNLLGALYLKHPLLYILIFILYDALLLGAVSLVSTTYSAYSHQPFVATILPLIAFMGTSYILSVTSLNQAAPNAVVRQAGGYPKNITVMAIVLLLSFALTLIPYWYKVRKNDHVL